jgi:hypothetical protein
MNDLTRGNPKVSRNMMFRHALKKDFSNYRSNIIVQNGNSEAAVKAAIKISIFIGVSIINLLDSIGQFRRAIFAIGKSQLKFISKSLEREGLKPRTHGNTCKTPKHALSMTDIQRLKHFLNV